MTKYMYVVGYVFLYLQYKRQSWDHDGNPPPTH